MEKFELVVSDGRVLNAYRWVAENPQAIVHIAHGMGEHAARYDALGQLLAAEGFAVYANDHRGHGGSTHDVPGYLGADGWNRVLADAYELNQLARSEQGNLPVVLFGHSMGAMLSQQYITRYGETIEALILSGSPGFQGGPLSWVVTALARFETWRLGPAGQSPLLQRLLFGDANKAFAGSDATGFEWLSRDTDAVQQYVEDEQCGFVLTAASLVDLFQGAARARSAAAVAGLDKSLPVYVFSGSDDPVHNEQRTLQNMVTAYRQAGLSVDYKIYPGGRHEMLNETNREEVMADVIATLKRQLTRSAL